MGMKVYGGMLDGRQRLIVAAPSWAKAHEVVNAYQHCSMNSLRNYWSITGNAEEIAAATAQPETVLLVDGTGNNKSFATPPLDRSM